MEEKCNTATYTSPGGRSLCALLEARRRELTDDTSSASGSSWLDWSGKLDRTRSRSWSFLVHRVLFFFAGLQWTVDTAH